MTLKNNTKTETNTYELEISVNGDVFGDAIKKVYKKQGKNFNIPGFRKGKAPQHVVEKMYGEDIFFDDAMQDCYPAALEEAALEAGLKIVAVDTLEAVEASKAGGFTFKATVIVEPEIEISDYKGIEIEKKPVEVTEELINEEIDKVRDRNSRMVTITDRPAQNGDTAVIDFEGFRDGVAFEGGKGENFSLSLGSGQFIPGFEEQVCGHSSGEEFTITVTFPEDYQVEELANKETQFEIVLHEIKTKELPELDDDFVKDVSEKDTVAEYKEEIAATVKERLEKEADDAFNNAICDKLIEKVEGEIPEAMYTNQVNDMIREFDMRLRQQGMEMSKYLEYMGMDIDGLKTMYQPQAEQRVKLRLALEKIAKLENFEVSEEEINAEFDKLAEHYKMEVEKVKELIPADGLAEDIKTEKAMNLVKEAVIVK